MVAKHEDNRTAAAVGNGTNARDRDGVGIPARLIPRGMFVEREQLQQAIARGKFVCVREEKRRLVTGAISKLLCDGPEDVLCGVVVESHPTLKAAARVSARRRTRRIERANRGARTRTLHKTHIRALLPHV